MASSNKTKKSQGIFSKLKKTLTTAEEIKPVIDNLYNFHKYFEDKWKTIRKEPNPQALLSLAKDIQTCFQEGLEQSTNIAQYDLFHKEIAHVNGDTVVCNGHHMSMAQFLLASRKEAVFIRDDNFIQVGGVGMHIDVYLAARAVLRGIPEAS